MAEGKDPVGGRPNGNGRSREIAADIDRTRDALDRTVDAIVGKLTPSQLLLELAHVFRSGSSSVVSRVVDTARDHPVPATIVAAGLGMMLWERAEKAPPAGPYRLRDEYDEYGTARPGGVHRMTEKAREATSGVAGTLEDVKGTVQERTHHVTEAARETAHHAREAVTEKLHEARETTHQAKEAVRERVQGAKEEARHLKESARRQVKQARIGFWQTMDQQPLVVGGIAVALGAAAALLAPRTEREDELMGEASERVREKAEDAGRQVLDKGKQVARTAGEVIRQEAREQGLTPDQLADKVRTVARDTEEAAVRTAEEELQPSRPAYGSPEDWTSRG